MPGDLHHHYRGRMRNIGDANRMKIRCSPVRTAMSRSINKRHFLPRKPGVIAYAGEEIAWIITVMNTFRICFIFPTVFNRGLITSGIILPSCWVAVKELTRGDLIIPGKTYA